MIADIVSDGRYCLIMLSFLSQSSGLPLFDDDLLVVGGGGGGGPRAHQRPPFAAYPSPMMPVSAGSQPFPFAGFHVHHDSMASSFTGATSITYSPLPVSIGADGVARISE